MLKLTLAELLEHTDQIIRRNANSVFARLKKLRDQEQEANDNQQTLPLTK